MKKKEVEVATNVSSGAEKVETVEKKVKKTRKNDTAKGDAAMGDSVKKSTAESKESPAEKEHKAAQERVEHALEKKEKKAKKAKKKGELSKKMKEKIAAYKKYVAEENAKIEKRLAEKKAKAEKHAAERKKIAEKRAAEKEEKARERARAKANRHQEKARKKANGRNKAKRKSENKEGRESRAKGYGGWIAAVIALGVTTLALASTVTVGAVEMSEMKNGLTGAQMGTMYELTGIMEHVDDDLDRLRISDSATQQSRILTDLLVQARLAEADLGKMPISLEKDRNITEFINRTAAESERMLSKLRAGEKLSDEDKGTLERLYQTNHTVRQELDAMAECCKGKDMTEYMKKGKGLVGETLGRLEELTLEENRAALEGKMEGAGMRRPPEEGENKNVSAIDAARAEELCQTYFEKYKIEEYQCVGETTNRHYTAYNVQGYDGNGTLLFAEIDRHTGALITFDYYEEGNAENFDLDNAQRIAEEFLDGLGYENLRVARVSQSGSTSDFTFVYGEDDVVYYPDAIRVKVCRTRGLVCGFDASKYLKNHRGRDEVNAKITMEAAYEKLDKKLDVQSATLAVVNTARGERAAYEFLCAYEENTYFVYLDANTGEEIAIVNTKNLR